MAEIDHAFAQDHVPGRPIRQPGALGCDLSREAKGVCGARTIDLQVRSGFPGESLRHVVGRGGKGAEFGVQLGEVVEPTGKPPEMSCLGQARQGLIDRRTGG